VKDHIRCEVVMEKGRYKMIICGSREEVLIGDKDAEGDMKMKYLDMLECRGKIWRWSWLLLSSLRTIVCDIFLPYFFFYLIFLSLLPRFLKHHPLGGFNSYWQMPFRKRARITIEDLSLETI